VPVVLGKNGVERIIELELAPKARRQFEDSSSMIKDAIGRMSN
jgi:malate/lactate dehydrogenase